MGTPAPRGVIRVYLLRQITVVVRGQKAWRNVVLGEGTLRAVRAPGPTRRRGAEGEEEEEEERTLNWEGEVRCSSPSSSPSRTQEEEQEHPHPPKIGGFNASSLGLSLKDFVVLSLSPPKPQESQLVEMQCAVPVRLVTDRWFDSDGVGGA